MKQIMKKAWEIAKAAAERFGGKASQYIAEALRMAWAMVKGAGRKIIDRIDELTAIGFSRWQKYGKDRLYIDPEKLGLSYGCYKSGSISWAEYRGESISNRQAYRLLGAKTYIDVVTEKVYSDDETLGQAAAELAGLTYES